VGIGAGARVTRADLGVLGVGLCLAILARALVLPGPGLAGDLALFISWASTIARTGLGHAYDLPLSFPPVLPWIWSGLALVDPGLGHANPGEPGIAALMKLPATLADAGMAGAVAWWFRSRPRLAIAGGLAILLAPAMVYISAWWGQFESIYVLPALLAAMLAIRGHRDTAAVLLAVSLMSKPQALPLAVPLAAWFVATSGWRGLARAVLVGGATVAVLWLPFVPFGGPAAYLGSLRHLSEQTYGVISLRAWNPWWLAQLSVRGQDFVSDGIAAVGPLTLRDVGAAVAAVLLLYVAFRVARRPTAEGLLWGMTAAALVAFVSLTTMHERYSYPALVFLVLLWPQRLAIATWIALLVVVTLNVVAAVPPQGDPGSLVPLYGPIGAIGSIAITLCAVATLVGLARATRPGTTGGSAAATAGA
jgi:hypothetical protein